MAKYQKNSGVFLHPEVPSEPGFSKLAYNGLLFKSGATEVYAHVGYGRKWENTQDYKMTKTDEGFEATIPIRQHAGLLNVCFKDSANNWDNNAGANYSFLISNSDCGSNLEVANEISNLSNLRFKLSAFKEAVSHRYKQTK